MLKNKIVEAEKDQHKKELCDKIMTGLNPKFVFGLTPYAESIAMHLDIDGFVDDVTDKKFHLNKPVIRTSEIPKNSIIISTVILARPRVVFEQLNKAGIEFVDYFYFKKYSGLDLLPVLFDYETEFANDFEKNYKEYEKIYDQLQDQTSKDTMEKIINFRLSADIKYLSEFELNWDGQYFEDFLNLQTENETFVDVGCFDGFTTKEFIKRCPKYKEIHVFEPENDNMTNVRENLKNYGNIHYHNLGLSNITDSLRFKSQGPSSTVSEDGDIVINVAPLDELGISSATFIKMDIEGGEALALEGAKETIIKFHPKLAICIYHKFDDFWKIPKQVFSYRDDYSIYIRHYTQGVVETVMYFVPKRQN